MHVMIDLETMGQRPDAPIISIGAVAFDATTVHEYFYVVVGLQSSVDAGARIDPSTVMWWLKQGDEARSALAAADAMDIATALDRFDKWIRPDVAGVWGNGASFDNVIMAESYRRLGRTPPWEFWKDRCYRTIKSIYTDVKLDRSGTHHNALHDAISQAKHLIAISKAHPGIL